ncbi:ABC transporter substrate-binding protein [Kamptonema animale CS-326]|jgi:NitT/TauT family transport system substrate-binding protein|uniref:ABC transporter substrate-binding protein n=1 Tax=Kamptonema animale TaxID=92934 RepID=UPI00232BB425|nr:ABC transporter substrate-binding protein [Kamptonema animale]MDB9513064.1 ABC transporter substrate-binding protein [Kamptonema animale CS-326]
MTGKAQTETRQLLHRFCLTLTKWRSLSLLCVLTLAVSLIVNACNLLPQQLTPLRVGITSWAGFDIALYAQEAGLFKQRGLEVQLIRFQNQQDATRAMLRGTLDANFASLWDVLQSDSGSDKPVVVMVTNISHGADGIVAQPVIKSVANLRGKRVGAKLGTVNHLILLEALKLHQIKPEEVKVEDISNETAVELMRQGRLDAAVIWQPLLGETAQAIEGNIIFTTGEVDSLVIDTLVSRSTITRTKKAELKHFIKAWFDIMSAVEIKPKEVFQKVANNLGQKGEDFAKDYAGLKKGDIAMQQQMFESGRLPEAIAQMAKLLKSDPRAGRMPRQDVEINTELVTTVIKEWKS